LTGFAPKFPAFFALLGVAWLAFDKRASGEAKLLLFSWLLTCVILVKNDLLGIAVFTQRFVTFFDEAVAVFAGLFVGGILVFACSVLEKRFASLN
jgi:hypothetical protein